MADRHDLLIEIGTEELPPKALEGLAQAFAQGIKQGLSKHDIKADLPNSRVFYTPRRLAVLIPEVAVRQPDQVQERRGPAVSAGINEEEQPTKALLGFAASCGVEVTQLEKLETDKGAWFVHKIQQKGALTAILIPDLVGETLKSLPIPKPMRWGNHSHSFVRPVQWVVMLHGEKVIDGSILGAKSTHRSLGHRFHHTQPVWVTRPADYLDDLRAAHVLADPEERKKRIRQQLDSALERIKKATHRYDLQVLHNEELLSEVNALVEWPTAIECTFEKQFLEVPQEALIQTMQKNQKFFPILNRQGKLTEHFIGIANVESSHPEEIRKGYERVIRPRFADAKFFFEADRTIPLVNYAETLHKVTYQQQLGTVWEKCKRVSRLCEVLSNSLKLDPAPAIRAAELSKGDLMTRMVGEFPELQGVMGRYYAQSGTHPETPEVAVALDEIYMPRYAGDKIAASKTGQILAAAERLDTLAGIFAIGQKPTGNKDPFALRRAALGLARTMIEGNLAIHLKPALRIALGLNFDVPPSREGHTALIIPSKEKQNEIVEEIYKFIVERLRSYYAEQGIKNEIIEAVRVVEPITLPDFDQRIKALMAFIQLPESEILAAANKRIGNILKQANLSTLQTVNKELLETGAESELYQAITTVKDKTSPLVASNRYVEVLRILATLRDPVDNFFNNVMVMTENEEKRTNRISILNQLRQLFLQVADISAL